MYLFDEFFIHFYCCLFQVTCVGQVIGAVLADTQFHAQLAAKAVKVQYEELKPIITIEVRYCSSSVTLHLTYITSGVTYSSFVLIVTNKAQDIVGRSRYYHLVILAT